MAVISYKPLSNVMGERGSNVVGERRSNVLCERGSVVREYTAIDDCRFDTKLTGSFGR